MEEARRGTNSEGNNFGRGGGRMQLGAWEQQDQRGLAAAQEKAQQDVSIGGQQLGTEWISARLEGDKVLYSLSFAGYIQFWRSTKILGARGRF